LRLRKADADRYNVSGVSRGFDEEDLDGAGAAAGDVAGARDDADASHGGLSPSSHLVRSIVGDEEEHEDADGDADAGSEHDLEDAKKKKKKKKKKGGKKHKDDCSLPENEDKPHCTFKRKPRHYSKHSPSRSNKPLSPLGYIQYYLRDVDSRSNEPPEWQIEYTTYKLDNLLPPNGTSHSSHHPLPIPLRLLPGYDPDLFPPQGEAEGGGAGKLQDSIGRNGDEAGAGAGEGAGGDGVDKDEKWEKFIKELKRITPWKMKDLTIPSYVKLARKLVAQKKLWKHFADIM
jgi:endopolyphosphatase